jgi:hypothetical protein
MVKEDGCDGLLIPCYSFHVSLKKKVVKIYTLSYRFCDMFTEVKSGEREGQEIYALQHILLWNR